MPDDDTDGVFSRLKTILLEAQTEANGEARLPSERKLAETLGVQRSTIRERLSTLESLGIVRRAQGSGTYIQMPRPGFIQLYFELAVRLGFISVDEMERAREMLEREIVRVAALQATDAEARALTELQDKILSAKAIDEGMQADHDFHMRLAYITRNPVIIMLVQGLSSVLREVVHRRRVLVRQSPRASERTNATHIAIVEAIRERNPDQAVAAMDRHFRVWDDEFSRISSGNEAEGPASEGPTAETPVSTQKG